MTLPNESEVLGFYYLRLVVGKMLVMDENVARIQLDKNSQYDKLFRTVIGYFSKMGDSNSRQTR